MAIPKFLTMLFINKVILILDDRAARLSANDKNLPLQIVYDAGSFSSDPERFMEKLVPEMKRAIQSARQFTLARPLLLVILRGRPEAVNKGIFKKLEQALECRAMYLVSWTEAVKDMPGQTIDLEGFCRNFPECLRDLRKEG